MNEARFIYHISDEADLAVGEAPAYTSSSLATEGFIHCSTASQVLGPANRLFRGRSNLVLLRIDPELVPHPVVYEDCYEMGEAYPHIYGELPWDAVRAVIPFPAGPEGTFELPPQLLPETY